MVLSSWLRQVKVGPFFGREEKVGPVDREEEAAWLAIKLILGLKNKFPCVSGIETSLWYSVHEKTHNQSGARLH